MACSSTSGIHKPTRTTRSAVRAGLAIVEAMPELSLQNIPVSAPPQVRIGIHTGLVVVGDIGAQGDQNTLLLGKPQMSRLAYKG